MNFYLCSIESVAKPYFNTVLVQEARDLTQAELWLGAEVKNLRLYAPDAECFIHDCASSYEDAASLASAHGFVHHA